MGTTLGNIHIYGETDTAKVETLCSSYLVKSYSEGWTSLLNAELRNLELSLMTLLNVSYTIERFPLKVSNSKTASRQPAIVLKTPS